MNIRVSGIKRTSGETGPVEVREENEKQNKALCVIHTYKI